MKLFPSEHLVYHSRLSEKELIRRLMEKTSPESGFLTRASNETKTYQGVIQGNTFAIKRSIMYRNSFLPLITGTIAGSPEGSIITVTMKLHRFVKVFMLFWLGSLMLFAGVMTKGFVNYGSFTLTPIGMLFFGFAMTWIFFKIESRIAKKDLHSLFEAGLI